MKLNFDILISILSHIQSPSDISAYSRTCRVLHTAGVRELIGPGVVLDHEGDLTPFLLFVTASDSSGLPRGSHIKRLTFNMSSSYLELGAHTECMARIIECCTALEMLKIDDGSLLDVDIRIGISLNKLEHLRELNLELVGGVVNLLPLLATMQSQCVKVSLEYLIQDDRPEQTFSCDPFTTLMSSISSLQSLYLHSPYLIPRPLVYLSLTSLTIYEWFDLNIGPLLNSFPNLERLVIDGTQLDEEDLPFVRTENQLAFASKPWSSLKSFRGSIYDLYALGITCPIKTWFIADRHIVNKLNTFSSLLHSTPFNHIHMTHSIQVLNELEASIYRFLDCLISTPMQTLSHLTLDFAASRNSPGDIDKLLEKIKACAQSCKLRYLDVQISHDLPRECRLFEQKERARMNGHTLESRAASLSTLEQELKLSDHLTNIHPDGLAVEFGETAPTLKYFVWKAPNITKLCWEMERDEHTQELKVTRRSVEEINKLEEVNDDER